MIDIKIKEGKKLVIYGTGSAAEQFINENVWIYSNLSFFMSTNDSREMFLGKKVISPEKHRNSLTDMFIIIASSFTVEISKYLCSFGLEEGTHFVDVWDATIRGVNEIATVKRFVNGTEVGKYSYGYAHLCVFKQLKSIGAFSSINKSVQIGVNHPMSCITTHPFLYVLKGHPIGIDGAVGFLEKDELLDSTWSNSNGDINIGNDVWIGANVIILPGVTIGDGAIIGAGSVVTRDVPDYAIFAGVPAKSIRQRFSDEQIAILKKVRWWDWDNEKIRDNIDLIKNPERFFEKYKNEIFRLM